MDNSEIIVTFFNILGSIIAIVAIIIVMWDHFKDDHLLTQRVQSFYETIENLIFTFYFEEYQDDSNENAFHHYVLMQSLEEYGKYLGLFINSEGDLMFVNFYIKDIRYLLDTYGKFVVGNFRKGSSTRHDPFYRYPQNRHIIENEEVIIIKKFLENLRNYWRENYSKRKIFRRSLKPKIEFNAYFNVSED
ncbi:MAG: hypothetical protein ACFE9I_15755 [Candidatus Hermodarchaeota archaeon]